MPKLAIMQVIEKKFSGFVAAIALSLSPILSVVLESASTIVMGTISSISLMAVILWWRLGKLEQKFYHGLT